MLNQDIWEGFEERIMLLNPFFSFGKGINLGERLNPFIGNILLAVLLEIFYREVRNKDDRSEKDMVEIVKEVMEEMKLQASERDRERIVTGLLYSNPQTLEPFERQSFSVKERSFKPHKFKYLVPDLDAMGEFSQKIIYKLSEDAQFMLFSSREITSELSISLEQLYMIQLLKKGNIDGVLKQTDFLLQRVRNLIAKEIDYGKELARNPKIILRQSFDDRSKRESEIRKQFEEEDENFRQMHTLLYRLEEKNEGIFDNEARRKMSEIRSRLNQTTNKHTEFNTLVTKNIAFVIDIRTNRPELLMSKTSKRYKEDVWEKFIRPNGIASEKIFEEILSPFFSPVTPTFFSMDRLWSRQKVSVVKVESELIEENETYEMKPFEYEIKWENIIEKWSQIIESLLEYKQFSLHSLDNLEGWTKEAIDLWLQFAQERFEIPRKIYLNQEYEDEREEFIRRLIKSDKKFTILQGCTLYVEKKFVNKIHYYESLMITDGTLRIEMGKERKR